MNPTLSAAFWLFVFPMLVQFVYLSFGPEPRWPAWAQGTLVPHYEYTPGCNGVGTGPCATCKHGETRRIVGMSASPNTSPEIDLLAS